MTYGHGCRWRAHRKKERRFRLVVRGAGGAAVVVFLLRERQLATGRERAALALGRVEGRRRLPVVVHAHRELLLAGLDGLGHVVDDFDVVALFEALVGLL